MPKNKDHKLTKAWCKGQVKDEAGKRFGKLLVLERAGYHVSKAGSPQALWACECECGNLVTVQGAKLRAGHTKSCGCLRVEKARARTGSNNPGWKGGKRSNKDGYVWIRIPTHPAASNSYVLEHRHAMEEFLGRYLEIGETVHHKNGVRSDNRIENLELWSGRHSKGQRVQDLVTWAFEIISKYEDAAKTLAAKEFPLDLNAFVEDNLDGTYTVVKDHTTTPTPSATA